MPPTAAGKTIACPKCKTQHKVPAAPIQTPTPPAPATPAAPAPSGQPAAPKQIVLSCNCGQKMKASSAHAGKTVQCPKCKSGIVVPGSPAAPAAPVVQPVQPVAAQPIQPISVQPAAPVPTQPIQPAAVQPLPIPAAPAQPAYNPPPNPYAAPPGALAAPPPGALGTPAYLSKAAAARGVRKTPSAGLTVALIGICIIGGGFAITAIGMAALHYQLLREVSLASSLKERYSMSAMQEEFSSASNFQEQMKLRQQKQQELAKERASYMESRKGIQEFTRWAMKISRPALVVGSIVAVVGYGICIGSSGAKMGLAIGAMVVGICGSLLDLIMRTIPYLTEKSIPADFFQPTSRLFSDSSRVMSYLGIEILMAVHLLLFSIFALLALSKKDRALPITAIVGFGVQIFFVIAVQIAGNSVDRNETGLYIMIVLYWLTLIAWGIGVGFLIGSVAKLKST